MTAEFEFQYRDQCAIAIAHMTRRWYFWVVFVVLVGGVFFSELLIDFGAKRQLQVVDALFVAALWGGALVLLQIILQIATIPSKGNWSVYTSYRVDIDETGISEQCPFRKLSVKWSGVLKVQKVLWCLAIYYAPNQAIVVPRRAFQSGKAAVEFEEKVRLRAGAA